MRKYVDIWLPLVTSLMLGMPSFALATPSMDAWQSLMNEGSAEEARGDYLNASRTYATGCALADKAKLPGKCKAIALCREIRAEVLSKQTDAVETHFQEFTTLVKSQQQANALDPEVGVWMLDLADTFLVRQDPKTRENYIKHACLLKLRTFPDPARKECLDCLMMLANYHIDHLQIDKAVEVLGKVEKIQEKKFGRNPTGLVDMLNLQAINYENKQQYEQAKQLELHAIQLGKKDSSDLTAELPAFYSLLGMNALAQGDSSESSVLFGKAINECRKINNASKRLLAIKYLGLVSSIAQTDSQRKKSSLAEAEIRQLLAISEIVSDDPRQLYGTISLLGKVLADENKCAELEVYLKKELAIAVLKNSYVEKDLPDLYMRLGMCQAYQKKIDDANPNFAKAIKLDGSKDDFHTALIYVWWGLFLKDNARYHDAEEKLNLALKIARSLPTDKRGTLIADALETLSLVQLHYGKQSEAKALEQQSLIEISAQRKVSSKLGPDIYHRVGS